MTSVLRLALLASLVASACGGVAREWPNEGDAGTGGYGNGGQGAAPGTGGKFGGTGGKVGGAGGNVGGKGGSGNVAGYESGPGGSIGIAGYYGAGGLQGTGGGACCKAIPTCSPGDQQLAGPCPPETPCYEVTACCSTIWCRHDFTCPPTGSPCEPGDQQIFGSCPAGRVCYQRVVCNSPVTCMSGVIVDAGPPIVDAGCSGPPPRGVHYVSTSPSQCALIDYGCPSGTTGYGDACGCGCRQPDTCPDYINCQPGPGPANPLCAVNGPCPYSIRAL